MPLTVRNLESGPTVFTDDAKKLVIEWQGAGDAKGRDVQQVPNDLMENAAFAQNVRAGVFEVLSGQSVADTEAMLTASAQAARADREAQQASILEQVDVSAADDDIIPVKCLISGEDMVMRAGDLFDRPPLADRYASRAGEFQAVPTGNTLPDGRPEVTWVPVPQAQTAGAAPTS